MNDENAAKILNEAKKRKIAYCTENGLPIPEFDKAEDFIIQPPRPVARWESIWKCTNCGSVYQNVHGQGHLPDSCPRCNAIMR